MKTKFLKIGMPIMVFMLAIVFAFATEKTSTNDESLFVTGYVMQDGLCITSIKDCNDIGSLPCTDIEGRIVHEFKLSNTVCQTVLFDWPF